MTWHPDFDVEMLNRAQSDRLGCVVIHHHGANLLSRVAQTGERVTPCCRFYRREAPAQPHAFVIMGDQSATGQIYRAGNHVADMAATRIVGSSIELWPPGSKNSAHRPDLDPRHDRLVRAFGPKALDRLRSARVGVVGNGGGGSHVINSLHTLGSALSFWWMVTELK